MSYTNAFTDEDMVKINSKFDRKSERDITDAILFPTYRLLP